ncbi:MAG: response regulator [Acidobacteriota bacterium]
MTNDSMIKILLVDDDEDCRLMFQDAVKDANIKNDIYEVGSGEEALDFVFKRGKYHDAPTPGLIYLDIDMPGMSGQEVLKRIKSDKMLHNIPIVMLTNLNDEKEKLAAAQNGANSYTVKSSDPLKFIATIIEATNYWLCIHQHVHYNGQKGIESHAENI